MLAVHDIGVVESFGIGDEALILVEDIAVGVAVMYDDAGADGGGLGDTFIGDFHTGEMAAAVLGDEAGLADGVGGRTADNGGGTGGHGYADGEAEGAVIEDLGFLII